MERAFQIGFDDGLAREVAAVERIDEDAAVKRLEVALQRAA